MRGSATEALPRLAYEVSWTIHDRFRGKAGQTKMAEKPLQTRLALMRNESEENVLSNYVEGLAASGTEAEHGEVIVE